MTTSPASAGTGWLGRFGSHQDAQWIRPDDDVQVRTRRHWLVPVRALLVPGLVFAGVLWLQLAVSGSGPVHVVLVGAAVVAAFYGAWRFLSWRHEIIYATETAMLVCHGLVARNAVIRRFEQVVGVDVDRSVPGRALRYCTLRLETAGQLGGQTVTFLPEAAGARISDLAG
jgi:uncharacterized membrane protein YdbT with pleckstrin-like domain